MKQKNRNKIEKNRQNGHYKKEQERIIASVAFLESDELSDDEREMILQSIRN